MIHPRGYYVEGMASLRQRLRTATAALLVLQVIGTSLGFVSWWRVHEACQMQQQIGGEREKLLELARTARELYVHQAHTFIEGGPGHLEHLSEDTLRVTDALANASTHEGPFPLEIEPIRQAIDASNQWFTTNVEPHARDGSLDRGMAATLHQVAEHHASEVQILIDTALNRLAIAEAEEVERVSLETRQAWIGVGSVVIAGLALGAFVSGRMARGILRPIDALGRAVRAFAKGEDVHVPIGGDSEIAELGQVFNDMVGRVRQAEAQRVERERVQALGEIAGAVAHELMSPIAAILGETRAEVIDGARIRAEADHARRVIQGLLGYARPGEAEAVAVRVDEAAATAVERAIPFADARGITLRWLGGGPTLLQAAPTAVRQVLDNLIRNAIDAMEDGEIEVELKAGIVEVRDRGAGIPAAVRARLYQPFVTGRPDGTGLGLAVSQRIAKALGGQIIHLPREGGGTIARWELNHG